MIGTYYLQLLLILGVATALAWWCGWGIARLAMLRSLQPYRGLLAPLLGYALVVVVGYWGVRTVLGIPAVLVGVLSSTTALNLLAWRKADQPRLGSDLRARVPLFFLLLVTLLVGLAPLLQYGHPAVIGAGWDTENYLPTARYLERGPISSIAAAPPNPLRDINAHPPSIGLTLGFSVWQASVDVLARSEALVSFAPLLAWLRTLGVLAVYLLLRTTLGLRHSPALLGAAFTSAGALLLWVSYFNFGMQLAAWPLIPLGLVLGVAAVEELADQGRRAWTSAFAGALAIAALPIAYYPALTLWGPLAAGLGLSMLIQTRMRLRILLAAGALALPALLLAAPTILDYDQGFNYRYSAQLTTLGLFRYIPLTDIAGLTPFTLREEHAPAWWAIAALAALIGLMLAGLIAGGRRLRWLGLTAGGLLYLTWLRWGQAYPYAYMKGGSYAAFVFLGLAAAGWQTIAFLIPTRVRPLAWSLPLLLLALMGWSQREIVAEHWEEPGLYAEDLPDLLELRERIPAGSTVTLTSDPRVQGVTTGLAAHLLDHTTVWGNTRTGYSGDSAGEPDAIGEYGLLARQEDPRPWGYEQPIWQGGSYALYQRPAATRAHLHPERELMPGETIEVTAGQERLTVGEAEIAGDEPRTLTFTIVSLEAGEIGIGDRQFVVPVGQSLVRLGMAPTPQTLTIQNIGAASLMLDTVTLSTPTATTGDGVEAVRASLYARARAEVEENIVTATIQAALPDSGPVALALDIWDLPRGVHYGWYGVELGTSERSQTLEMRLDLSTGTMQATGPDGADIAIGARFEGLQPGEYVARLQASAGEISLATPADLFSFTVHDDGAVGETSGGSAQLVATTNRPPRAADVQVGDDVRLLGYALPEHPSHPGETVDLILWWQAQVAPLDGRSVLVHLLDAKGEKVQQADGPPAGGSRPTEAWQRDEVVLDRHQFIVPPDLAPGDYSLAIGMYRWPSLERLPLAVGGTRQEGELYRIPFTVEGEAD